MYFVLILYPSSIVIVLISHKTLSLPVLCCHFLLLTLSHPSYRGTNRPPPLLTCCAAPYHINTLLYTCLVCNGIIGKFIHYNFFLWNHSLMHFERCCYFLSFVVTSYETKSFLLVKTVTLSFYITYVNAVLHLLSICRTDYNRFQSVVPVKTGLKSKQRDLRLFIKMNIWLNRLCVT